MGGRAHRKLSGQAARREVTKGVFLRAVVPGAGSAGSQLNSSSDARSVNAL